MKTGAEIITDERTRQIEKEKWSESHDDAHKNGELARAAAAYALPPKFRELMKNGRPKLFPWRIDWWKPTTFSEKDGKFVHDRVRQLAKAGALIAAEIDRLQRLNDKL